MLTYILIALVVLFAALAIFLIYVATLPAKFAISRSAVLPAPADQVFAIVNDFHQWNHWSPWARLDPNCKTAFDGASSGVGAKFAWNGNCQVGTGHMTIVDSRPNDSIKIDLTFTKPMQATNVTLFTFKPEVGGTRVTWAMSGVNNFMGKLFGLLMNCDKMVGDQFENGFANMKEILATGARV
jgi:uncharacterized protein YndB with AHSA1/START domain